MHHPTILISNIIAEMDDKLIKIDFYKWEGIIEIDFKALFRRFKSIMGIEWYNCPPE